MEQNNIHIRKVDSLNELKCQINKEQLIMCDDVQNAFWVIELGKGKKMGIAHFDYGILPAFRCSDDGKVLYLGIGSNFICFDISGNKVLINEVLNSVFYELLYDFKTNYICVMCELDLYCYYAGEQKWKIGFRDIVMECYINDDNKIFVACADGSKYTFFLENGKEI